MFTEFLSLLYAVTVLRPQIKTGNTTDVGNALMVAEIINFQFNPQRAGIFGPSKAEEGRLPPPPDISQARNVGIQ